jgi:HEAT repeat protein
MIKEAKMRRLSYLLSLLACLSLLPISAMGQESPKGKSEAFTYAELSSDEVSIRRNRILKLAKEQGVISKSGYASVFNALSDEDETVRYYATIVLSKKALSINDKEKKEMFLFVPKLLERLEEDNPRMKDSALRTIGLIKPPYQSVAADLNRLSQDADHNIRTMALDAVFVTTDTPSVTLPIFLKALNEDSSSGVRGTAALRIASLGYFDQACIAHLIKALDDPTIFVRTSVMNALTAAGVKAVDALRKLKEIANNSHTEETEKEFANIAIKQISSEVNLKEN